MRERPAKIFGEARANLVGKSARLLQPAPEVVSALRQPKGFELCRIARPVTATSEGQSGTAQITVLSTTDLYALMKEFVEDYWNASFTNSDLVYSYVQVFEGYGLFPPFTPCGEGVPWNAFYCPANAGVYYHTAFLDSYLDEIGDLAPAFIISHEIGHHVSWQLGWIPGVAMSKKQNELQADCFGGAWVRSISDMDLLETGDLEEAALTLFHIGNPEFTWFNPNLHGTSLQRLLAFAAGFDDGPARCTSTEWLGQFPTPPAEAPARPLGEGAPGSACPVSSPPLLASGARSRAQAPSGAVPLAHLHPAVLPPPPVVRLLGDAELPADQLHGFAAGQTDLCLPQCSDDLLRSVSLPSHPDLLAEKLQTRSILTLHLVSFQGVRSMSCAISRLQSLYGWRVSPPYLPLGWKARRSNHRFSVVEEGPGA